MTTKVIVVLKNIKCMLWRNMINVNHLEENCCVAHCKPDKYKCQRNNKDFCTQIASHILEFLLHFKQILKTEINGNILGLINIGGRLCIFFNLSSLCQFLAFIINFFANLVSQNRKTQQNEL